MHVARRKTYFGGGLFAFCAVAVLVLSSCGLTTMIRGDQLKEQAANAGRAGDNRKAAKLYEQAADTYMASHLLDKAEAYNSAASYWKLAGDTSRAQQMEQLADKTNKEDDGNWERAADLSATVAAGTSRYSPSFTPRTESLPSDETTTGETATEETSQEAISERSAGTANSAVSACTSDTNRPKCKAAGDRLKVYIDQRQSHMHGAAGAAVNSYCQFKVLAEVSRVWADEYAAAGRPQCAALAYQQRDELLAAVEQSKQSAEALSTYNGAIERNCEF